MAEKTPYIYQALPKHSQTRLLKLEPVTIGAPISLSCKLHTIDLKEPVPKFRALSYVWGDTDPSTRKEIYAVDEGYISITANLYSFLVRLTRANESIHFLWADGICINQGTDPAALHERSRQVGHMRSIYEKAERVIVDLYVAGPDDWALWPGLEDLEGLKSEKWDRRIGVAEHKIPQARLGVFMPYLTDEEKWDISEGIEDQLYKSPAIMHGSHPFWPALERLLNSPWFRRIWILQEMALNQETDFFICGNFMHVDDFYPIFCRALRLRRLNTFRGAPMVQRKRRAKQQWTVSVYSDGFMIGGTHDYYSSTSPGRYVEDFTYCPPDNDAFTADDEENSMHTETLFDRHPFVDLYAVRWRTCYPDRPRFRAQTKRRKPLWPWIPGVYQLDLLGLFLSTRTSLCVDPRDRVYAIMGLDSNVGDDLTVDYEESVANLSFRFSNYIMSQHWGKIMLYLGDHGATDSPSWAIPLRPTTNEGDFLCNVLMQSHGRGWNLYDAAGGSTFSCLLFKRKDIGTWRLEVRGHLIGEVRSRSPTFTGKVPQGGGDQGRVRGADAADFRLWIIEVAEWVEQQIELLAEANRAESKRPETMGYKKFDAAEFKTKCLVTLLAGFLHNDRERDVLKRFNIDTVLSYNLESLAKQLLPSRTKRRRLRALLGMRQAEENYSYQWTLLRLSQRRALGLIDAEWYGQRLRIWPPPNLISGPRLCQLPGDAQKGDRIAIINGCPLPFVLREVPVQDELDPAQDELDPARYRIIGCCYVDGAVDGEAAAVAIEEESYLSLV